MKIIAISQRLEVSKFKELRPQLDIKFFNFISLSGYLPVPIPYFAYKKNKSNIYLQKWINVIKPHGIILSGGEDIGKNKIRDDMEYFLISLSKKKKIPILGICRGMQIIAKFHGSKLIKVKNHVGTEHFIISKKKKVKVNSFHNQAIENCPKNFSVNYKAEDGVIESISSINSRIEGWMWHPERYKKFKSFDINSFQKFFK